VKSDDHAVGLLVIPAGTPANVSVASGTHDMVKRVLDVIAALVLLVVAIPVMLIVAVAVAATSRGPVLYGQQRVGRDGRLFTMRKFRSMAADTDARIAANGDLRAAYEGNQFKLPNGLGLETPIGRFLRRTSLDELPQLVNVLLGEMSLVGVRPIEPRELARRSPSDQDAYRHRRPGLTGLWQVNGRSRLSYEQRCALDHEYVTNWSLAGDLKILVRTPRAVLRTGDTR
jgi:lipopolysaccharide/colanic/teichoic acid biosynthesis glycosyltransferase